MSANTKHTEPRERPILFSAPMILAILREKDPKTVTRRLLRPGERVMELPDGPVVYRDSRTPDACGAAGAPRRVACPFGVAGDRLWVRETWRCFCFGGRGREYEYLQDQCAIRYRADSGLGGDGDWRPSIFMPRWASRITLEVTDVRVERLHAITEEDARAEGVDPEADVDENTDAIQTEYYLGHGTPHRVSFMALWDQINGKRSPWLDNPWCWRVEFRRVKP